MEILFDLNEDGDAVCRPLKTLEEIREWLVPRFRTKRNGDTLNSVIDLTVNAKDCSPSDVLQAGPVIASKSASSQLVVCHDLCGGYLEDRFSQGCPTGSSSYRFYHWQYIDVFIYFSHNFVTIPPPGWIKAAHKHGVTVLGTVITEWEDGVATCKEMLKSQASVDQITSKLAEIALFHGFDGWLINIENKIEPDQISLLQHFVQQLTIKCHTLLASSKVLWYDSVINTGELKWQDELNSLNEMFFHVSDGIFLNYLITPEKLARSHDLASANGRQFDVFAGVDVFGRGSPHGGGFNSKETVKMIMDHGLSCALFAPAWVYEILGKEDFDTYEEMFWGIISDLRIPRPVTVPFATSFCQGYGEKFYLTGEVLSQTSWYNVGLQQIQPSFTHSQFISYSVRKIIEPVDPEEGCGEGEKKEKFHVDSQPNHPAQPEMMFDLSDGFYGGGCMSFTAKRLDSAPVSFRIFKIRIKEQSSLKISVTWKTPENALCIPGLLLAGGSVGHIETAAKIICTEQNLTEIQEETLTKMFSESAGLTAPVPDRPAIHYTTADCTETCASHKGPWNRSHFTADLTSLKQDGEFIEDLVLSVVLIPSGTTATEPTVLSSCTQLCLKVGHLQIAEDLDPPAEPVETLVSNMKCLEVKLAFPLNAKHNRQILMNPFLQLEESGRNTELTLGPDHITPTLENDDSCVTHKQKALSSIDGRRNSGMTETVSKHTVDLTALQAPTSSDPPSSLYVLKWETSSTPVDYYLVCCYQKSGSAKCLIGQTLSNYFVWKQHTSEEMVSSFSVQPVSALSGRPLDEILFTL